MTDSSTVEDEALETAPAEDQATESSVSPESLPEEGVKETSMLDAVNAALSKEASEASPPAEPREDGTETEIPAEEAKGEEPKEASDKASSEAEDGTSQDYGKGANARIRKLVSEVNEYKAKMADLEQFKQSHETVEGLKSYMAQHSLTEEEVNVGFDIMAAMRGDPQRALQMLEPYVEKLREITGQSLPADLQQKVEQGMLTEQDARELSQAKAGRALEAQRRQRMEYQLQAEAEQRQRDAAMQQQQAEAEQRQRNAAMQQQQQAFRQSAVSAVAAKEQEWRTTDPDFAVKSDRVKDKLLLDVSMNGFPKTIDEMVMRAEAAKKAVDLEFKSLMPPKPARVVPKGSGVSKSTPQPANMLEVINSVVG